MGAFIVGMLSSLVASGLLLLVGWLKSARLRGLAIRLLARISGNGVVAVYDGQEPANSGFERDLKKAKWFKVMAGRGNELTRDRFANHWREVAGRLDGAQVLLPNPDVDGHSWLDVRETELARHDAGFGSGTLKEQVRANILYVVEVSRRRNDVEVRLYNLPNIGRIFATDRALYLTTYSPSTHGRHSPTTCFTNGSPFYEFFVRVFDAAWETALPIERREAESRAVSAVKTTSNASVSSTAESVPPAGDEQ